MNSDYGHWDVSSVGAFNELDFFGFIYEIEEMSSGKIYIGRKQFSPKTKKANNWRTYTSSSKELCDLINEKGKENFKFRIVNLCSGKSQLTYEEERLQFINDVLRAKLPNGEKKYFNKTIGYKNFNGVERQTEASKLRISLGNSGKTRTDDMKRKYSKSKKGVPKTENHKNKLRKAQTGKIHSTETNLKKGKGPNGEPLVWWNDGETNTRSHISPGESWNFGRIMNKKYKILPENDNIWIIEKRPSIADIVRRCNISAPTARRIKSSLLT